MHNDWRRTEQLCALRRRPVYEAGGINEVIPAKYRRYDEWKTEFIQIRQSQGAVGHVFAPPRLQRTITIGARSGQGAGTESTN